MKKFLLAISLILCYTGASADQKVVYVVVPDSDYTVKCIRDNVGNALQCNWSEWNERERTQREAALILRKFQIEAEIYRIKSEANLDLMKTLTNQEE